MKKMRASLLRLVLVLGLVLMGAQAAGAYEFTYLSSGFIASAAVPDDSPPAIYGDTYAGAEAYGDNMYGQGFGEYWFPTPNSIGVGVRGETSVNSPGLSGSAYGSAVTTDETGVTTGIYFQLTGGEGTKDLIIPYTWSANIHTGTGGTAILSGGSDPMYISVNGFRVWQTGAIWRDSNQDLSPSETGTFVAHIGDIIGINLAASANIVFSAEGSFYSYADNSMTLGVPLPPSALLLGSGLLGLLALGGYRFRRR